MALALPSSSLPSVPFEGGSVDVPDSGMAVVEGHEKRESSSLEEREPKILRIAMITEDLHHVDEDPLDNLSDCSKVELLFDQHEDESPTEQVETKLNTDALWYSFGETEPSMSTETLKELDSLADRVELERLVDMTVLMPVETVVDWGKQDFGGELSSKFVRTWRKKCKGDEAVWLRRSRLVAREFNTFSRDDICTGQFSDCPKTSARSGNDHDEETADFVLRSGDITDAYLQVPQSKMRPLKLEGQTQVRFYISKCLPGQRDAARRWCDHLARDIHEVLGGETCLEQPSMFRLPCGCVILAHVDDLLFWGSETSLVQTVIPKLESKYRVNFHYAPKDEGGTKEFLKRVHVIEPDYTKMFIHSEKRHAEHCFDVYKQWTEKLKRSKVPGAPHSFWHSDTSTALNEEMASIYRSLTGSLMYLSHDRVDLQFTTKSLASYLSATVLSHQRSHCAFHKHRQDRVCFAG